MGYSKIFKRFHRKSENKKILKTKNKKRLLPTNQVQRKLYIITSNALGSNKFGINSNLFEYGLNSINCITLINRINKEYDISIKLADLIQNCTILDLEKVINEYKNNSNNNKRISDLGTQEVYPLTMNQKFYLNLYKENNNGNNPYLFKLNKTVDLALLKASLEKLVDIHVELKNLIYQNENGNYTNYRDDNRSVTIPLIKLSDQEWESIKNDLVKPFNFNEDSPLYHIGIYETESFNYLFMDISLLICDDFSLNLLIKDLNDLYNGKIVEPKKITGFEYLLYEKENEDKALYSNVQNYYSQLLEGLTIQGLPFIRKEACCKYPNINGKISGVFQKLSSDKLKEFCKVNNITENTLFLVSAAYALTIYENTKDVRINSMNSGRIDNKWNKSIGPFNRMFTYRYSSIENETIVDSLHRLGKQIVEAFSQDYSFFESNSFIFNYLGEIFDVDFLNQSFMDLNKNSSNLLFKVYSTHNIYYYNVEYWKNIYDDQLLKIYLNLIEDIIVEIIQGAKFVEDLRKLVSVKYMTSSNPISINTLNQVINQPLINEKTSNSNFLNAYILNSHLEKQIIGGWGDLYIEINDSVSLPSENIINHPFGDGKLYKTGLTGRLLPDETLSILENDGRYFVRPPMIYTNANILDYLLNQYEGIEKVSISFKYMDSNLKIIADIYGKKEPDMDKLNKYLNSKLYKCVMPSEIIFHELK